MERNLGNEFEEAVKEMKALVVFSAVRDGVGFSDGSSGVMAGKMCQLADRLLGVSCEMFKRQEALMTKLDEVLDLYLEQNKE